VTPVSVSMAVILTCGTALPVPSRIAPLMVAVET